MRSGISTVSPPVFRKGRRKVQPDETRKEVIQMKTYTKGTVVVVKGVTTCSSKQSKAGAGCKG